MWTGASDAYTGGNLVGAVRKAGEVKTRVEALSRTLRAVEMPAVRPAKS